MSLVLLVLVLVLVALLVLAAKLAHHKLTPMHIVGGTSQRRATQSKAIIIDTLNLAHWLGRGGDPVGAIDATSEILLKKYEKVTYVLKDRTSVLASTEDHARLQNAAERNKVTIAMAERYADPPQHSKTEAKMQGSKTEAKHAEGARDDFYLAVLAGRQRCAVATNDRLRDFQQMRSAVPPFHVWEFAHWRAVPARDFIRPSALRVRRPHTVTFEQLGI